MLSSHLVGDLERICDYLVVLAASKTVLAADIEDVLATHRLLVGPRRDTTAIERDHVVLHSESTARQTTLWARLNGPVHDPAWQVDELGLEDIVLAYLGAGRPVTTCTASDGGVMTWLLWRQHRMQAAVAAGLLAALRRRPGAHRCRRWRTTTTRRSSGLRRTGLDLPAAEPVRQRRADHHAGQSHRRRPAARSACSGARPRSGGTSTPARTSWPGRSRSRAAAGCAARSPRCSALVGGRRRGAVRHGHLVVGNPERLPPEQIRTAAVRPTGSDAGRVHAVRRRPRAVRGCPLAAGAAGDRHDCRRASSPSGWRSSSWPGRTTQTPVTASTPMFDGSDRPSGSWQREQRPDAQQDGGHRSGARPGRLRAIATRGAMDVCMGRGTATTYAAPISPPDATGRSSGSRPGIFVGIAALLVTAAVVLVLRRDA